MRGFFIAGTDTGVGKTWIARALCSLLAARGLRPAALKPVETGCEPDQPEDALALQQACGGWQPLDEVCPYRFRLPAAPLVAARAEHASIDLARIEALAARHSPIIVEAAGGLLVPLAEPLITNLDLARTLGLPIILVARAGLGTLNHSALSAQALQGLPLHAIVLNRVAREDDPTVASNAEWVARMTGARVLGPTPWADTAALQTLLAALVDSPGARR